MKFHFGAFFQQMNKFSWEKKERDRILREYNPARRYAMLGEGAHGSQGKYKVEAKDKQSRNQRKRVLTKA